MGTRRSAAFAVQFRPASSRDAIGTARTRTRTSTTPASHHVRRRSTRACAGSRQRCSAWDCAARSACSCACTTRSTFRSLFLGALYAGVVPVCANTLLTVDDYAYMLEHSRRAGARGVGRPSADADPGDGARGARSAQRRRVAARRRARARHATTSRRGASAPRRCPRRRRRRRTRSRSGCTRPARPGRPKGTVHTHANLLRTEETYGRGVLDLRESDVTFSAAKLFFAYGLGNALTFPLSVGATVVLMARASHARRRVQAPGDAQAHGVLRRADAVRGHARLARAAVARRRRAAPLRLRGRAVAQGDRRALRRALRLRRPRRHRIDRDAAHLPVQSARRRALRHDGHAGARLRHRAARRGRATRGRRRDRRPLHPRSERRAHVLGERGKVARDVPGRVDAQRRQVRARRATAAIRTPGAATTC